MNQRAARLVAAAVVAVTLPLVTSPASATESVTATRVAGADRHATAAAIALAAFPDGSANAVLARGDAFPDALAGSFLAGAVGGPVLLTTGDQLSDAAASALDDLDVETVHVLGGTGAVSTSVSNELESKGYTVERIAGASRYATAARVAEAGGGAVSELDGKTTALLASGADFPDALAAGPLAFAGGFPILLTPPDALASEARTALTNLAIEHVLVLGGTAAVSDEAEAAVAETGATTERLAGDNRFATAAAIADVALDRLGWSGASAALARGDAFPDGLAGGPHAGRAEAPILLTAPDALSAETGAWLATRTATVGSITAYGGTAAVSDAALAEARAAAGDAAAVGGFAVSGAPSTVDLGGERTCTVAAPADATVELRLLPSRFVTIAEGQPTVFEDAAADGAADTGTTQAVITALEGRTLSPASARADSVDSDGAIDVVISSSEYDSVILVAFVDAEDGTEHALDVDDRGRATDAAVTGCRTVFAPPEASLGTTDGVVVGEVDVTEDLFIDSNGERTFRYGEGDTFESEGTTATLSAFEDLLSQGDTVDIDYSPDDGASSAFFVVEDVVLATGAPDALADANDVQVSFAIPASNGAGTDYRISRTATVPSGEACSVEPAETGTTVGSTDRSPFVDTAVPDGCYRYRIVAVASNGLTAVSPFGEPVKVPGTPPAGDVERPRSTYAAIDDAGTATVVGAGDTITLVFSEPLAQPTTGTTASRITVSSSGVNAAFTNGSGSSFALNATATTVAGVQRPAGTVLTVTISANPSTPPPIPADITSSSGITDVAANTWDLANSSDRTLEASP